MIAKNCPLEMWELRPVVKKTYLFEKADTTKKKDTVKFHEVKASLHVTNSNLFFHQKFLPKYFLKNAYSQCFMKKLSNLSAVLHFL